ncbi:MAG: transporter substrate-binding domain-containing protein [Mycobacterium sp.]|nr:transporter substrate-binding domain-containing protein [Mycobacterium sp.]
MEPFGNQLWAERPGYQSPADLLGKRTCTVAKTTSAAFLTTLGVKTDDVASIKECYNGIRDHRFDAVVFDAPVLQYHATNDGVGSTAPAGPIFQTEDYGIAFHNGSNLRK